MSVGRLSQIHTKPPSQGQAKKEVRPHWLAKWVVTTSAADGPSCGFLSHPSPRYTHELVCLPNASFSVSNESMAFKWLSGDSDAIMIFAPLQSFLMNAVH